MHGQPASSGAALVARIRSLSTNGAGVAFSHRPPCTVAVPVEPNDLEAVQADRSSLFRFTEASYRCCQDPLPEGRSDARARPILLTAAAASLALIPISRQIFWGPMAYAMMGGIIAGTVITLVFVPALYLAVFRVKRDPQD